MASTPTREEDRYGNVRWRVDGDLHRVDGPAVEYAAGGSQWWLNDQLHRADGPAIVSDDGTRDWFVNGRRHRINGPAIERPNGIHEWWICGRWVPPTEIAAFEACPIAERELIADLYGAGTSMADAIAAAARLR